MRSALGVSSLLVISLGLPATAKPSADALMEPFRFGMSREEITEAVSRRLDKDHEERIARAADPVEAERLARRKKAELAKFKASFVEFGAEKSAWDVSVIGDQFAHGSGESLLMLSGEPRRYLFLFEGKLWRVFIEHKLEGPEGKRSFEDFSKGLGRKTPELQVEALDLSKDFGAFAVVLWDPAVMKKVASARKASAASR